ncbi:FAD-dependent monooxygenase [Kutzneria sp. CA-103260]|uniref:FAD-dependent monooxygenase n=1 Tax=Kutzneria sp. CA-103260 TaxID=2802641 RepID=UPI001BF122F9|nr:FAD-dependent monooxygenase [Kutzneria sp. CA-103260]QUQ67773.1 FAD-dependent oxidoreductase [Kutzneria sp. CA-103260]
MRVLVSGASIAGPAVAYWLSRHGFAVTVVEQAPALRPGGQAIDVRGVALEVVERMGLMPRVQAVKTRMRGMTMYDREGTEEWSSTEMTMSAGRLDSPDVELLREDLCAFLHEATRDQVDYVFGDSVTAVEPDGRVEFERGRPAVYDLVIGADGLHSTVRRLVFGPERDFLHSLRARLAIFSAPNFLGLDNWQVWQRDGLRGYCVYPVRDNAEVRVIGGFEAGPEEHLERVDAGGLKQLVADRFAGFGGHTAEMLTAMWSADDLYSDVMAQVRMPAWTSGRVALVGDAACCPSPITGQGTSLALVGAYVLGTELGRSGGDPGPAFAAYERRMRPFVDANQALARPDRQPDDSALDLAKNAITL